MAQQPPDIIPGLAEFWTPDESLEALEKDVLRKPPKFSLSKQAQYPFGITYRGPWETMHDGVCIAVRRNACALRRSKLPVFLQSFSFQHWNRGTPQSSFYKDLPPAVIDEVDHLTDLHHERNVATIHHFVPSTANLLAQTSPGGIPGGEDIRKSMLKRTAAYVALEHDKIPKQWIECFGSFACVIVPCTANERWLAESGIDVPVHVVPHPMALRDPIRSVQSKYTGGTFRFLHVGKWEPRKNQHAAIGAFLSEFNPTDDVQMVLKCTAYWTGKDYPHNVSESVMHWLKSPSVIARGWTGSNVSRFINVTWNRSLPREELAELYRSCHAYLQIGRSEGFDLPAFDARVAGLRLVAMAWGGPAGFVGDDDVIIEYENFSAPPAAYNAPEGTLWPHPAMGAIGWAMRRAFICKETPPRPIDATLYTIDAIGAKLRSIVEPIAATVGVDLKEYRT
jgi:glycosyltransferase involved in cell wall biosynthesis